MGCPKGRGRAIDGACLSGCKYYSPLILLPGLRLTDKRLYRRIFDLYVDQDIDFIDAHNTAHMEKWGLRQIFSYDLDFDRVAGIAYLEP